MRRPDAPRVLITPRLILSQFEDRHADAFAAMHADLEVMHDYDSPLSAEESAAKLTRYREGFARDGIGRWAIESADRQFLGYVGVQPTPVSLPLPRGFEIGWRLARAVWGRGYASEAAVGALSDAFHRCGIDHIIAFTGTTNRRSEVVMRRIGMNRRPDLDFVFPEARIGPALVYQASYADLRKPI